MAVLLYRMSTGALPDFSLPHDELYKRVVDPLMRQLIARAFFISKMDQPIAGELVELIVHISPIVLDQATEAQALLRQLAGRVEAAGSEAVRLLEAAWDKHLSNGGASLLLRVKTLARKFDAKPMQPFEKGVDLKTVHGSALEHCVQLLTIMRGLVQSANGEFIVPPSSIVARDEPLTVEQCRATVKEMQRAKEKVDGDYGGDARCITDLVRATGVFKTPIQLESALEMFESAVSPDEGQTDVGPRLRVVRAKDKFNNPIEGYRDLLLNVALEVGGACKHVGELQLHLSSIYEEKKSAHVTYGITRGFDLSRVQSLRS